MPAKGDPASWLAARLKPGDLVIDVGANEGSVTRKVAEAVGPSGIVWAIEPDPRCVMPLEAVMQNYPHVRLIQAAASAAYGETEFHQAPGPAHSSRYRQAISDPLGAITVSTMPIDDVTFRPVAAVKIDVQGGEADVLAGATRLLRDCPLWVIELWPWILKAVSLTPASVIDPLVQAGLSPRYLAEDEPVPTPADLVAYCHRAEGSQNEHINVAWVRA